MTAPAISSAVQRKGPASHVFHRFLPTALQSVGELEFAGNAGSADLQDDGYALDLRGGDLSRLQSGNAPLLWSHDVDNIIGRILSIRATDTALPFRATFPAPGASEFADEKRRLLKSGVINGVSLGFTIEEASPIVAGRPNAGRRATRWTAYELSLCAIPIDAAAVVTERARRNMNAVTAAQAAANQATEEHRAFGRHHEEIADATERMDDHRRSLGTALRGLHKALAAGDHDAAREAHDRCMRCMTGMKRELSAVGDRHSDATDAYGTISRALRTAGTALDSDSKAIQTSDGVGEDQGSRSRWRSRVQRDLEVLRLAASAYDD